MTMCQPLFSVRLREAAPDPFDEPKQVIKAIQDDISQYPRIDFRVTVHDEITESGHGLHAGGQFCRQPTRSFQQIEQLAVRSRFA